MNFKEIAENYNKHKRKMMTDAVVANRNHTKNFASYHATSLYTMFAEWHLLFPTQKQDIKCTSCRAAIVKFWETIVDEWIEQWASSEETPKKTPKKSNAPKKKKTKAK